MKKFKKREGFTLIELVIVIAIISVLAAIAIPRYQKSKEQAAITAHNANVSMLKTAGMVKLNELNSDDSTVQWSNETKEQEHYVDKWPSVPKSEKIKEASYTVTINPSEGTVEVTPALIELDSSK